MCFEAKRSVVTHQELVRRRYLQFWVSVLRALHGVGLPGASLAICEDLKEVYSQAKWGDERFPTW